MKKTIIPQLEHLPKKLSKKNRILVRAQQTVRLGKCKKQPDDMEENNGHYNEMQV